MKHPNKQLKHKRKQIVTLKLENCISHHK